VYGDSPLFFISVLQFLSFFYLVLLHINLKLGFIFCFGWLGIGYSQYQEIYLIFS
jgi:hypothetical protein